MDRELAIERLNKMRCVCDMEECNVNCDLCEEALNLAIRALEREIEYGQMIVDYTKGEALKSSDWEYTNTPTNDCVSRQQAIEALQDDWIPVSEGLPEPCTDVQVTCEVRYLDGMKHKYQSIAQWIPKNCEEALRINWDVEVTEYNEEKDEYYPLEGWYESIKNWDEFSLVAIGDFVIAWQPLSAPYKESKDI